MNPAISISILGLIITLLVSPQSALCANPILSPPETARWTVSLFSDSGTPGSAPDLTKALPAPLPKTIRFTKTGDSGKVEKVTGNHTETEYAKASFYLKRDEQGQVMLVPAGILGFIDEVFLTQFPGVGWARPQFLIGPMLVGEEPCQYFRRTTPETDDPMNPNPEEIVQEAWFSEKSGLPVAFRSKGITRFYQFEATPNTKVILPPEFQKAWNAYHRPPP